MSRDEHAACLEVEARDAEWRDALSRGTATDEERLALVLAEDRAARFASAERERQARAAR